MIIKKFQDFISEEVSGTELIGPVGPHLVKLELRIRQSIEVTLRY